MKSLFFDLDGTIVDSSEGIFASVRYAMAKMQLEPLTDKQLRRFIGPPLSKSFEKLGLSPESAAEGVAYYRENYRAGGIFQAQVYDGIATLLAQLGRDPEISVYLATSKPEVFAKQILEHFQLAAHFDGIYGADMAGERVAKEAVLAYALAAAGTKDKKQAWMIGDREHDMIGGALNGVTPVGVLWGFGDQQELATAGAKYLVETPLALADLITTELN